VSTPAVVVLGHSLDGHRRLLVAEAERTAARTDAAIVVFTGWSADDGPSEAARMRSLWRGRDVELVVEETASTTAENASRTLPLLRARGIDDAIVVCAPLHLPRARWIFGRIYGPAVHTQFRVARVWPTPGALAWEIGAVTVAARQVRAARAELE
jgi:uncharacterized SAM-binding protein YcdF (DUF218 family)